MAPARRWVAGCRASVGCLCTLFLRTTFRCVRIYLQSGGEIRAILHETWVQMNIWGKRLIWARLHQNSHMLRLSNFGRHHWYQSGYMFFRALHHDKEPNLLHSALWGFFGFLCSGHLKNWLFSSSRAFSAHIDLGAGTGGGGGYPSVSSMPAGVIHGPEDSVSAPPSSGCGNYLPTQSQASYHSASSSPSARRPSSGRCSCFLRKQMFARMPLP